jgi:uncharacterized PurR-regulated membrane protein YhhQ (DUF165 family)
LVLRVLLAALYGLAVVAANWMILHVGTPIPGSTRVLPVGFGLYAPSGTYLAAAVLVFRDLVQRSSGRRVGLGVIVVGIGLTAVMNPRLAFASGTAFGLGELLDFAVYTPLRRRLGLALLASCAAGAVLDSLVFLSLAGIPLAIALPGQIVGKVYVAALAYPLGRLGRHWVPQMEPKLRVVT